MLILDVQLWGSSLGYFIEFIHSFCVFWNSSLWKSWCIQIHKDLSPKSTAYCFWFYSAFCIVCEAGVGEHNEGLWLGKADGQLNQLLSMTKTITKSVIIGLFPKTSINFNVSEVYYGSHEPILSHRETKKYQCHSFELCKFWKYFWNYVFPCITSASGRWGCWLVFLNKRQITLRFSVSLISFKNDQIKKVRLRWSHCNHIINSCCQRWNIMNLSCTLFNPLWALLAINKAKVISTVNITSKSHLDRKFSENTAGLFTVHEKSINKMLCPCKMKCG